MRVNSYNKFFAEVAKIMNTEVKSVKQLDGRYKVELTNHVCLNVYRGVSGSLFIHDHRGMARITSCYDFDDFKTLKDLYERLITDYSESTNTAEKHYDDYTSEDCIENAECARGNDVFDGCKQNPPKGHIYIDSVKVAPLPEQQTWKRYNAIVNPEWHHVSLAALANIDNDMLDKKRRHYMKVYRMTANVINSIYKCNKLTSIDKLRTNLIQTVRTMAKNEKIEWALVQYVKAKIDNCYLVNGLQSSFYSKTYGHNKSRSYTKTFFI